MIKSILTLIFCLNFAHAKTVEKVLAVVEGQMILASEVKHFSKKLKTKTLVNENLINFLELNQKQPSSQDILNYLVSKKVITSFALKDLNIASIDTVIEKEVNTLAKQNQITTSQLKKEISSRGIDYNDYRNFIGEASLIRSAIERNVVSKVRPTEEDFVSFLKENGISNIKPSYVYDLDQIYISKDNPDAKKTIQSITSSNFKKYFASADNLNLQALKLGSLKASDLSKTHASTLSKTSENSITKVFEEKSGYRIFYVNLKKGNFQIPNTANVKNLQKKFYDSKIQEQFKIWMSEIKPTFFVRLNK